MNGTQAKQIIGMINGFWRRQPMSKETARLWSVELVEFDFDLTAAAVRRLARTKKGWPPDLADIVELVDTSPALSASEAFAATMASISPYPAAERARHIPAACMEAVRLLGGWSVVGKWKKSNLGIHQRDFERVYSGAVEKGENREAIGAGTPALNMLKGAE